MDPFTALGRTVNLLQFADFAWKLVTETREIAKSTNGSNENTRLLTSIMMDIKSSNAAIESITTDDESLKNIIKLSGVVSRQLVKVPDELKVEPHQSRWASFTVALKGIWKKRCIEGLFESVSKLRQRVLEHLSVITL
jgi:hypothetical protein